jgi:hypothetical protein
MNFMRCAKQVLLVTFLAVSFAPAVTSAAQGRGRGHADGRGASASDEAVVIDRDGHRRIVRDFYRNNALPPGLARRQSLPPGLEKQLRERGELPPGLQKRLTPVPSRLAARLPGLPPYYSRYFAGSDLLVVDTRFNRIVSVIPNIF